MSRIFSLSLLALSLVGASLGRAADASPSGDFYLPVSYDMVITRSVAKTSTDTKVDTALDYEIFKSRDLLRSILDANEVTSPTHWSLVALGTFGTDPSATDTLSTLQIVARNSKTGQMLAPTSDIAIAIAPTSSVAAYSRKERQTKEPVTVVASSTSLSRIAELDQKLLARTNHAAGTLVATGLVTYTNSYGKVTAGGETTDTPVLRPTAAVFRGAGQYQADGDASEDGIVEVLITLGSPTYFKPVPTDG